MSLRTMPRQLTSDEIATRWHAEVCTTDCRCPESHARVFVPHARSVLRMGSPAARTRELHDAICSWQIAAAVAGDYRACPCPHEHGDRLAAKILGV